MKTKDIIFEIIFITMNILVFGILAIIMYPLLKIITNIIHKMINKPKGLNNQLIID